MSGSLAASAAVDLCLLGFQFLLEEAASVALEAGGHGALWSLAHRGVSLRVTASSAPAEGNLAVLSSKDVSPSRETHSHK